MRVQYRVLTLHLLGFLGTAVVDYLLLFCSSSRVRFNCASLYTCIDANTRCLCGNKRLTRLYAEGTISRGLFLGSVVGFRGSVPRRPTRHNCLFPPRKGTSAAERGRSFDPSLCTLPLAPARNRGNIHVPRSGGASYALLIVMMFAGQPYDIISGPLHCLPCVHVTLATNRQPPHASLKHEGMSLNTHISCTHPAESSCFELHTDTRFIKLRGTRPFQEGVLVRVASATCPPIVSGRNQPNPAVLQPLLGTTPIVFAHRPLRTMRPPKLRRPPPKPSYRTPKYSNLAPEYPPKNSNGYWRDPRSFRGVKCILNASPRPREFCD